MNLIAPDILADACSLSLGLMLLAVPIGAVLWLLGWWSHRFWVVLLSTVLAGIGGLQAGPNLHAPPVVGAVLLALTAGVLALYLVRLVAFTAGGLAGLLVVQAVYPSLEQPIIAFLVSGLVCLALFRPCMMALTSLIGAILLVGATLMLLTYYAIVDAPLWCEQSAALVNWLTAALAALGFVGQMLLDRYVFRKGANEKSWLGEFWKLVPSRGAPSVAKPAPARKAA
jgi:hypothetical protein